ncbi:MAG: formimidoylglutamate deiminase [Myxococcota bacterium]
MNYLRAKYILDGVSFRENAVLQVDGATIVDILSVEEVSEEASVDDLGDVAVVPGLVNAHSHAFQRMIRGRTEFIEPGREDDDFWSWRERMYRAALTLDPEQLEAVARMAFLEMALTGVTSVGEFHYLHHQSDGTAYADANELAKRVIAAARHVGMRINLLRVGYNRAGFDVETNPRQRRFIEPDVDTYLARVFDLERDHRDDPCVSVGMAPHSIRAVPREWLESIASEAGQRVVHIHASEQQSELEQSRQEYGATPIEALAEVGLLGANTTVVHATHATSNEIERLAESGATVCACPTTERNLGDGFLPGAELVRAGVPVSLGSDSHANIDLWEEMRLVEYHERLRHERRNVLASAAGVRTTAEVVWPMGSRHGARCLGQSGGALAPGADADFTVIDLDHISLVGATRETLLSDLALAMTPGAVRAVYVAGERLVDDGAHQERETIVEDYRRVLGEVFM